MTPLPTGSAFGQLNLESLKSSVIGIQDRYGVRSSLRMWMRRCVATTNPSTVSSLHT